MKAVLVILLMLSSSSAFSAEPAPLAIFAAILKDSGMRDATKIRIQQYTTFGSGETAGTGNNLFFQRGSAQYVCSHAFAHAHEIAPGQYLVDASIANCREENGSPLILDNDYSVDGVSLFRRVFFENNSKFRPLTSNEEIEWSQFLLESASHDLDRADRHMTEARRRLERH